MARSAGYVQYVLQVVADDDAAFAKIQTGDASLRYSGTSANVGLDMIMLLVGRDWDPAAASAIDSGRMPCLAGTATHAGGDSLSC